MRCLLFAVLAAAVESPPDGYTLLAGTSSTHAIGPAVNPGSPALPGVPTVAEALPGFEVAAWIGFFAPPARRRRLRPGCRTTCAPSCSYRMSCSALRRSGQCRPG